MSTGPVSRVVATTRALARAAGCVALSLFLVLTPPATAQDTIAAGDTAAPPAPDTALASDTISEVAPEHWPRVTGRLTDRTTGEPIAGATLRFAGLDVSAVSDSAGRFVLPRVPPGTHELEIRHVAYGTRRVEVTVRADVTTRLQLRLEPRAVEVEPIEVRVEFRPEYLQEEGFYERMERGGGEITSIRTTRTSCSNLRSSSTAGETSSRS